MRAIDDLSDIVCECMGGSRRTSASDDSFQSKFRSRLYTQLTAQDQVTLAGVSERHNTKGTGAMQTSEHRRRHNHPDSTPSARYQQHVLNTSPTHPRREADDPSYTATYAHTMLNRLCLDGGDLLCLPGRSRNVQIL